MGPETPAKADAVAKASAQPGGVSPGQPGGVSLGQQGGVSPPPEMAGDAAAPSRDRLSSSPSPLSSSLSSSLCIPTDGAAGLHGEFMGQGKRYTHGIGC